MSPEEVPDELVALADATSLPGCRHSIRMELAAILPEHEKQVRAKVAEEILGDVAALFAARVGADPWEAAYRAARVARGEPS